MIAAIGSSHEAQWDISAAWAAADWRIRRGDKGHCAGDNNGAIKIKSVSDETMKKYKYAAACSMQPGGS